jgi:uncharacterized protein (TIGR02172 family)
MNSHMEISLSHPIAEGRTAEIYEWQDGYILKLYYDWCPPHWVTDEARVARAVSEAGIPAPAAGEIVEVNGRRGLVYERILGISMLQDMNTRPWMLFKHARTLAELQAKVHQLSFSGLESYKEGLMYTIRRAPYISDELRAKVLEHLATLPEEDRVCHGDFHPGNVLLASKEAVIIDWMTASSGNRWADVARTSMLLNIGAKSAGKQVKPIVRLLIRLYHQVYLNRYQEIFPSEHNELKRWIPVIAAARLEEKIDGEQYALIEMVRDGLTR